MRLRQHRSNACLLLSMTVGFTVSGPPEARGQTSVIRDEEGTPMCVVMRLADSKRDAVVVDLREPTVPADVPPSEVKVDVRVFANLLGLRLLK
jgi:hypothetical protein